MKTQQLMRHKQRLDAEIKKFGAELEAATPGVTLQAEQRMFYLGICPPLRCHTHAVSSYATGSLKLDDRPPPAVSLSAQYIPPASMQCIVVAARVSVYLLKVAVLSLSQNELSK